MSNRAHQPCGQSSRNSCRTRSIAHTPVSCRAADPVPARTRPATSSQVGRGESLRDGTKPVCRGRGRGRIQPGELPEKDQMTGARECCGVHPTATPLFLDGTGQAMIDRLANVSPLERLGTPADIAEACPSWPSRHAGPMAWFATSASCRLSDPTPGLRTGSGSSRGCSQPR